MSKAEGLHGMPVYITWIHQEQGVGLVSPYVLPVKSDESQNQVLALHQMKSRYYFVLL